MMLFKCLFLFASVIQAIQANKHNDNGSCNPHKDDIDTGNNNEAKGPKVAVIGCGPAGMFFLRQLHIEIERLLDKRSKLETSDEISSIDDQLSNLPRPTVFEKDSKCGGLWQSKSMTPKSNDNDKEDISGEGMYDGMWINAPKELFEFADYTFDDHFGRPMPSYITRQQVLSYIEGSTESAIHTYTNNGSIRFETEVTWIEFLEEKNLFEVQSIPSASKKSERKGGEDYNPECNRFDKVVLATGTDHQPYIPSRELEMLKPHGHSTVTYADRLNVWKANFDGGIGERTESPSKSSPKKQIDQPVYSFDGAVLHSSNINKLGDDITGKNFLFIGSAYSAEDLALSFIKRGANHIYINARSDDGIVGETAHWPMDKVTIMMRTELKEVLPNNRLRIGRRKLQSPAIERIAKDFYNQTHENFVLEDIDAVVFCTGYDTDDFILDVRLLGYAEYNGILFNAEAVPEVDPESWPNIYDPSVFDPQNGKPLPSETELTSCGMPLHNHSKVLRADPNAELFYDSIGTCNHQLVTIPGFFLHYVNYQIPLLNLDIQSAYILKVITGEVPTPSTRMERFNERSRKVADFMRHSSTIRYYEDPVYAEAMEEQAYEIDIVRPYDTAYTNFRMLLEAKLAGHPAGSFLEEVDQHLDLNRNSPNEADEISKAGCLGVENYRFEHKGVTYKYSERGEAFMRLQIDLSNARADVSPNSTETFRDKHYDSLRSVYTGTKSVPYSKPWIEIDDILGDCFPNDLDDGLLDDNSFETENSSLPVTNSCSEKNTCHSELRSKDT